MKTFCHRRLFRLLLSLCLSMILFPAGNIYGQKEDFNLWTDLDIKLEMNKHLDLEFSVANRLEDNASRRDESLAEAGLEYKIKWFSTGFKYRIFNENNPEGNDFTGHRFVWQFSLEKELDRFELSMRNRFQTEYVSLRSSETGNIPRSYYRNRIKLEYDIKKVPLKPYSYFELYYRTNKYTRREIEKNRISVGTEYEITKLHEVSVEYFYEFEGAGPLFDKKHVVKIGYSLNL